MVKKLLRLFVVIVGIFIGPGITYAVFTALSSAQGAPANAGLELWAAILIYFISGIISGIIFLLLSNRIVDAILRGMTSPEGESSSRSQSAKTTAGIIGLIIGFLIATLLTQLISSIPAYWISVPLTIITFIIFGALGYSLGYTGKFDLSTVISRGRRDDRKKITLSPKILDTSAIIDGRIYDICKTGIIEGSILIPGFVVTELQHISDSADSLKRQKGRRGLDILSRMQNDFPKQVSVTEKDYRDIDEVDAKLIRLAADQKGTVVTLDYNLNKVAKVYSVPVFNINELANAVKPVLLPGEELKVIVVKDGKEAGQGVAYLDDGTMIVIEGAGGCEGQEKDVAVTSVLQTAAGRMIFAKVI